MMETVPVREAPRTRRRMGRVRTPGWESMSLPVTGWGDRVRTSGFLVLYMSWNEVGVAIVDVVALDQYQM